ncbi:MAG: molybdopterin cofactor-binding domain-containing protein [Aliidongia sp.]
MKASAEIVELGKPTAAMLLQCASTQLGLCRRCLCRCAIVAKRHSVRCGAPHRRAGHDERCVDPDSECDCGFRRALAGSSDRDSGLRAGGRSRDGRRLPAALCFVDDVGKPINPLRVEGQVHGGLAQGIGQALSERYEVDPASGQVLSGSYMDYGMPRAGCLPRA